MAITHTVLDARTDTLVGLLRAATYLNAGLPSGETVTVVKGPWDAGRPDPGKFLVYVSRAGLPSFEYGTKADPVIIEQRMAVACYTSYPADRELMEEYVGYVAANTIRCLLGAASAAGVAGWHSGVIEDSDAIAMRSRDNTTHEVETFDFRVRFEVDR